MVAASLNSIVSRRCSDYKFAPPRSWSWLSSLCAAVLMHISSRQALCARMHAACLLSCCVLTQHQLLARLSRQGQYRWICSPTALVYTATAERYAWVLRTRLAVAKTVACFCAVRPKCSAGHKWPAAAGHKCRGPCGRVLPLQGAGRTCQCQVLRSSVTHARALPPRLRAVHAALQ